MNEWTKKTSGDPKFDIRFEYYERQVGESTEYKRITKTFYKPTEIVADSLMKVLNLIKNDLGQELYDELHWAIRKIQGTEN